MSLKNTLVSLLAGYSEEDLAVIADNQRSIKDFIGSFLVDKSNLVPPLHPDILARMAEFKITVEEGQNLKPTQFNLADLTFRSFINKDDKNGYIAGEEMRRRAVKMKGNLGLADAKNLLDQLNSHPDKRKDLQGKYIVLPNNLLRGSSGRLHVACLYWLGVCWCLGFDWLVIDWLGGGRFACSE